MEAKVEGFDIPKQRRSGWEIKWERFLERRARWCCNKWLSISSKSERYSIILFTFIQVLATVCIAAFVSLLAMQLAHSPMEVARCWIPASWIFRHISPSDGLFIILVVFSPSSQ